MNFPIKEFTESTDMTEAVGRSLARLMSGDTSLPRFVAMYGDLGVGKTAFVRGFCSELCPASTVKSPTFALVNEYKCPVGTGGIKRVYHFDMYRVDGWESLYSTGFFDYMETESVLAVEWSENIENALPDDLITVDIKRGNDDNERIITISSRGEVKIEDIGD